MKSHLLKTSDWFKDRSFPLLVGGGRLEDQLPAGNLVETSHHHDFDELTVIVEGKAVHSVDGVDYELKAGDLFIINQGHSHYFHHREGMVHLNIMYDLPNLPMFNSLISEIPGFKALFTLEPFLIRQKGFIPSMKLSPRQLQRFISIWDTMKQEQTQNLPGAEVMLINCFQEIIVFLSRLYTGIQSESKKRLLAIENVNRYMEKNYARNLTLEDFYTRANMSRAAFMKHFKESTGLSPIVYLNNIRIEKACEMLRKTRKSMTDITFDTGFTNSNYFSRTFKKVMNMSPSEYRRKTL